MNSTESFQFEIRIYDKSSKTFGDAHEFQASKDIEEFDEYVAKFTDRSENERARPFTFIVAGRQWTNNEGQRVSAFARKVEA